MCECDYNANNYSRCENTQAIVMSIIGLVHQLGVRRGTVVRPFINRSTETGARNRRQKFDARF